MTPEERDRILVEAEGGCWHPAWKVFGSIDHEFAGRECTKCGKYWPTSHTSGIDIPDFSKPENILRLLKIAKANNINVWVTPLDVQVERLVIRYSDIDQISALVAGELARIIEAKK